MRRLIKNVVRPLVPRPLYRRLVYRQRWRDAARLYADEFASIAPLLTSEKSVIDCGAHMGIFSRFFAERSKSIDAYEPNPLMFDILSHNCPKNVRCHDIALSDRSGTIDLVVPVHEGRPVASNGTLSPSFVFRNCETISIPIQTQRLDDQHHHNVSLLKIDVEGHELGVIRGAASFLAEERPHLWIEIEQRFYGDRPITDVFEDVCAHGYDGFFYYHGSRMPIEQFHVEAHQSKQSKLAEYVANFLFVPERKEKKAIR